MGDCDATTTLLSQEPNLSFRAWEVAHAQHWLVPGLGFHRHPPQPPWDVHVCLCVCAQLQVDEYTGIRRVLGVFVM